MVTWYYVKVNLPHNVLVYDKFASKDDCERFMNEYRKSVYPHVLRWEEVSEAEYLAARAEEDRRYEAAMKVVFAS